MKFKKLKLLLIGIIIILGITVANASFAFLVFDGEEGVAGGHFQPHKIDGNWMYCIQWGGSYNATLSRTRYNAYKVGDTTSAVCVTQDLTKPWEGKLRYMKYTFAETLDQYAHQDEAYILATALEEGNLGAWDTAYATWASSISNPRQSFAQADEGKAYKKFYEEIHSGNTDIFATKVINNTDVSNVKKYVNQNDGYYIVGPFYVEYPNGMYDGKNKFSWVTNIKAVTDAGELPVEVLNEGGSAISLESLGQDGTVTLNNTPFYIKFYTREATQVTLKMGFKYLEHCDARMDKYTGKYMYWYWDGPKTSSDQCTDTAHGHNNPPDYSVTPPSITAIPKDKRYYQLKEEAGTKTQNLIALVGDAKKVYKEHEIILGDKVIDLTIQIGGRVFIDQDTGKINTGDNVYNEENEGTDKAEGLKGVEVKLYYSNGEQVKGVPSIVHVHQGNSKTGGACYKDPVYHTHNGSQKRYGTCYSEYADDSHIHTGTPENGGGCYGTQITHKHEGRQNVQGGCYQTPVYHYHDGNEQTGGACYRPVRHVHNGNTRTGGDCYSPVYHEHNNKCYKNDELICTKILGETIDKYERTCGKTTRDIDRYELRCHKIPGETIERYALSCGMENGQVTGYALNCGKENEVKYKNTCGKTTKTVEYYKLTCTKSFETVTNPNQPAQTLTGDNGLYAFGKLNAMKKYYVCFTYNGMLYTNVETNFDKVFHGSKSTELAQGHTENRENFNKKYAEIGSYPSNYEVSKKLFEDDVYTIEKVDGKNHYYNRTYLQEEIIDLFKQLSERYGDISYWKNADKETKRKVQYAYDCRINAYSVKQYPTTDKFVVINEDEPQEQYESIGGESYIHLYSGKDNPKHINLGIKARATFDMALYKDGFKADVIINEKTETYEYDARTDGAFAVGISESDYLNGMGKAYKAVTYEDLENNIKKGLQSSKRDVERDTYQFDMRSEEIANGQSEQYKVDSKYKLNEEYDNLEEGKNNADDRLKIFVTYKIAIRNQSSTIGAITEIVDYYDTNYNFVSAYVGNGNGEKIEGGDIDPEVTRSKYSDKTKCESTKENKTYKTIYLRPTSPTKLASGVQGFEADQYIYVKFQLVGGENDAGKLLTNSGLLNGDTLTAMNYAEINGYKTYYKDGSTPGLVDIDSNPGNFDLRKLEKTDKFEPIKSLADIETIIANESSDEYKILRAMYEDDTSRAPAYIYKKLESRTLEGQVFEDNTKNTTKLSVDSGNDRVGDGILDTKNEKGISGVIVQLVEIKDTDSNSDTSNEMIVRATTKTDQKGWYGFIGFLPGDYTVRYIYGSDDDTALTTAPVGEYRGLNARSYNGQDYQSTQFNAYVPNNNLISNEYNTAGANLNNKDKTTIYKYSNENNQLPYYWYADDPENVRKSDAFDDAARRKQVVDYSKGEYGVEIVNHKAEVFNSYKDVNSKGHTTEGIDRELINELEDRTYRFAYTPEIEIEVEHATETKEGNTGEIKDQLKYKHNIKGVDFGIVERPKSELVIDQDIKSVKITATDGTVLVDTANGIADTVKWVEEDGKQYLVYGKKLDEYGKTEFITIDLDDELLSGANLEVEYNITITNNSENDYVLDEFGNIYIDENGKNTITTNKAKTILNYVANNLNFDVADNSDLWEVVDNKTIQKNDNSTLLNQQIVDISTQTTILKATDSNPLSNTSLEPGQRVTSTLKLKKTLSAESSVDDLTYSNMSEIVEIDNTVGRYDHGAIPGNQKLEEQPQEHDTSGASRYAESNMTQYPQDGKIVITPPTGSPRIYYVIGTVSAVILLAGVILIKKFVVDKKK